MKIQFNLIHFVLTSLIILCSYSAVFAQKQKGQGTSIDEYYYATRIYASQIQNGEEPYKENYTIEHLYTYKSPVYISSSTLTVDFIGIFKEDIPTPKATIAIANKNSGKPQYICIPHPKTNIEIRRMCDQTVVDLPEYRVNLYYLALQEFYTHQSLQYYHLKNK